jgi:hypothetical protein
MRWCDRSTCPSLMVGARRGGQIATSSALAVGIDPCGAGEKNSSMDPHSTALPPHATARAVACGDSPDACVAGGNFCTLLTHSDALLTHADARASPCVDGRGGAAGGVVEIARHAPRVTTARLERQRPGVRGRKPGGGVAAPRAAHPPHTTGRPGRAREPGAAMSLPRTACPKKPQPASPARQEGDTHASHTCACPSPTRPVVGLFVGFEETMTVLFVAVGA